MVEALAIEQILGARLGNWFMQLSVAVELACELGIKYIFCPEEFSALIKEGESGGIKFSIGREYPRESLIRDKFWGRELTWNNTAKILTPLLIFDIDKPPSGDNILHLHFRGGDIFNSDPSYIIQPNYAPPPLAFYKKVLFSEPWQGFVIVMEDEKNPVANPVIDIVKSTGLPYRIQSSTVLEDVNELFSATNLVACVGTFVVPIIVTSLNLKKVYFFGWGVDNSGVQTIGFQCKEGWLPRWKNTEDQRKELLECPEDQIVRSTPRSGPLYPI